MDGHPASEALEPELQQAAEENHSESEIETDQAPREQRRSSRRERKSRPSRESVKKATPSQWILGGCMLTAGVLGFFALSGDFGGSDAPPTDGWRHRAESNSPASFETEGPPAGSSITVRREPTSTPQDPRDWSNPAEGEIIATPSSSTPQGIPNFIGATGLASGGEEAKSPTPAFPGAGETHPAAATRPTSHEASDPVPLTAPSNTTGSAEAMNPYPTTGATGLNPFATPARQASPANQSGNAYPQSSASAAAPHPGAGNPAAGSSFPPVSNYPSTPHPSAATYPNTASYPSNSYPPSGYPPSGYPTTGAAPGPYSNTPPTANNPRYERIR
jgi:hypothetical protein